MHLVGGFILLGLFISLSNAEEVDADTLRFVHVIWRHGDRSPSKGTFPTDANNSLLTWPQGWGELTKEGMKQHYGLGSYLRRRYIDSGFLSKDYNSSEIYIRSTSYNRTIMSALANLAGMFPPQNKSQWIDNIAWQPIPVHSAPKENDPMLWTDLPCPTANDTYFHEVLKSDAVRQIEKEHEAFLQFLRNATGAPLSTPEDWWSVFDPLNCEMHHPNDHKWPKWMSNEIFEKVAYLNDVISKFYFHDFRLQRLRGGLLFGDIATRMDSKARRTANFPDALKYYAYSAHDTTMIALMENLGVYHGRQPEYATAILFELHEMANGHYIVKVFHINETGSEKLHPLIMEDCGATESRAQCDLHTFVEMARSHTPNDWYAECGIVSPDVKRIKLLTIAVIALTIIAVILLIAVIILLIRIKRASSKFTKLRGATDAFDQEISEGDIIN